MSILINVPYKNSFEGLAQSTLSSFLLFFAYLFKYLQQSTLILLKWNVEINLLQMVPPLISRTRRGEMAEYLPSYFHFHSSK